MQHLEAAAGDSSSTAAAAVASATESAFLRTDAGAPPHAVTKAPTIVYASRTHSQLTQVVNELKKTAYAPRTIVLGSRQQMCIHPRVSEQRGAVQNNQCRTLVKNRSCVYHRNVETFVKPAGAGIQDIEEIAAMGRARQVCPYYYSRSPGTLVDADVVFVPYNYIIDRSARRGLDLNWDNCVIIFDEAHNLDQVCSDSASFDLTAAELAACMEEVDQAVEILLSDDAAGVVDTGEEPLRAEEANKIKALLGDMEEAIDLMELPKSKDSPGLVKVRMVVACVLGGLHKVVGEPHVCVCCVWADSPASISSSSSTPSASTSKPSLCSSPSSSRSVTCCLEMRVGDSTCGWSI